MNRFKHFNEDDKKYYDMIKHIEIAKSIDMDALKQDDRIKTYVVSLPTEEYQFLHEAAIIEFKGKLYMMVNSMVSPDHIHSLELFVLNEETDKFERLWTRPIPFKLNTNIYTLPNGKLLLPGRIAELDGFPNTPAVLISDSGKIDAQWRLVKIQEDGKLGDGAEFVHPELSAVVTDEKLYIFSRNDQRQVPLIYITDIL